MSRTAHDRALLEAVARSIAALCDVEIASSLRGVLLGRRSTEQRVAIALLSYLAMPLIRHGHQPLLARILDLRRNFSAYDGTYVALAERLGADLVATDQALSRAVSRHTAIRILP